MKKDYDGILITYEGLDNSGKSMQAMMLTNHFLNSKDNKEIVFTREPGEQSMELTRDMRYFLANREVNNVDDITAVFLMLADRSYHVNMMLRPALKRGAIVVCDRYYHSMLAYQSSPEFDLVALSKLNLIATGMLKPDVIIFMDTKISVIEERRKARQTVETNDMMDIEQMQIIQQRYKLIMNCEKNVIHIKDDGSRTPEEINSEIISKIDKLINK